MEKKSFLSKVILPEHPKSMEFKTLDEATQRRFAEYNPKLFLTSTDSIHFVIDEVKACVNE